MKSIVLIALSVILVLQSTSAFPQQRRVQREAQHDLELSPEAEKKREELVEYVVTELVQVAKDSVDNHKRIFEKVVKYAEEAELKSDALKEHLQKFTAIIKRANELTDLDNEDAVTKLFDLFGDSSELADKYDDLDKPTEEESLLHRLLEENGGAQVVLQFLVDFVKLRSDYEKHIQEYVDSLSEADKVKDAKFIEWFEKFKSAKDFESYVDVTMEIFDFLVDDDDSEEKKE